MIKIFLLFYLILPLVTSGQVNRYPWRSSDGATIATLSSEIKVPDIFVREVPETGSFGHWLQNLPLKTLSAAVHLYDGSLKTNQAVHTRVIDIDTGTQDLQQCADALIRLRAEFLFCTNRYDKIIFFFTSGERVPYSRWLSGERPLVENNRTRWVKRSDPDSSYGGFRKYLQTIFIYAGSYSLARQMHPVASPDSIRIGDCFIQGGFPGHAVIVVDIAIRPSDNKKFFLLAQSYMPAQDIHVLRNINQPAYDPWYEAGFSQKLVTPEWTFNWRDLKRF